MLNVIKSHVFVGLFYVSTLQMLQQGELLSLGVIEDALPESWIRTLDPLAQHNRLTLAKLIATQSESRLNPVINPQTGKPIPRAIIVDDPDLQNLAREGKFSTLLRHPLLTEALADPKIQKLLRDLNL